MELKIKTSSDSIIYAHSLWELKDDILIQTVPKEEFEGPSLRCGDNIMLDDELYHVVSREVAQFSKNCFVRYRLAKGEWKQPEWIVVGTMEKEG